MPRTARIVFAGYPHHVTQKGNYGQAVFREDADRLRYLQWLCEYKARYGVQLWAWCLMENHVHLVVVPSKEDSLALTLHHTNTRYVNYVNRKHDLTGHLWQGRYYSCVLDGQHLAMAVRYVEMNPVRAGIVERAQDYAWSSTRAHLAGRPDAIIDLGLPTDDLTAGWQGGWNEWLNASAGNEESEKIRSSTCRGRPLGSPAFVKKLEKLAGQRLKPLARGRPRSKGK